MSSHTIEPGRLSLDQFISSASDAELVLLDMPGPGDLSSLRADVCWGPKSVPKSLEACRLLPLAPQNIVAPQVLRPLTFHDVLALSCNAPISEQEATLAPLRGQLLHAEILLEQIKTTLVEKNALIAVQAVHFLIYYLQNSTTPLSVSLNVTARQEAFMEHRGPLLKAEMELGETKVLLKGVHVQLLAYDPQKDTQQVAECKKTLAALCEQGLKCEVLLKQTEIVLDNPNTLLGQQHAQMAVPAAQLYLHPFPGGTPRVELLVGSRVTAWQETLVYLRDQLLKSEVILGQAEGILEQANIKLLAYDLQNNTLPVQWPVRSRMTECQKVLADLRSKVLDTKALQERAEMQFSRFLCDIPTQNT